MNLSSTFANLRKKVAGLTLATLVVSMFATGVATAQSGQIWKDVPADAWFFDYVNNLTEAGVVDSPNTSNDSMYRPGALVTRAEMAKFIVMAAGIPMKTATAAPFKDVPMGQWYTDYVHTLASEGIVSGDMVNGQPTGTFRPAGNVTRAEAAKFMVNGFMFANDTAGGPHFPDVASSAWFYNYVETAYNNQLVAGYPDGMYRPANNINRAEIAKMLDMAMGGATTGFVLEDAAAASSSSVMATFSANVDSATAGDKANYTIEDSSGSPLNVSTATVDADKSMVKLLTGTQTSGKTYYVTAKNVKSETGETLANTDSVSFLGYGSDVSGGALAVALSSQTPVSGSVPNGATGVVFTCWDFKAGASAVMLNSLRVHRVGPGSDDAFADVYLYRGDSRLTTGRSINSESQMVEFNNINQSIAANQNAKMCVVADLDSAALSGGVHAFEIASAGDVMSNSSNMTGSFPLRGNDQLITSATVGDLTVDQNGSLDEVSVGETGARVAQFDIEAGTSETVKLSRLALYVRGSVSRGDLKNFKLYSLSGEKLAEVAEVNEKDLAVFVLATPYVLDKGESKIFYVTADIAGARNGDTIKIYLDETTDVFATGGTYGYGVMVDNAGYDGDDPADFSEVLVKGSDFTVISNPLSATEAALNQDDAVCLDLTMTNAAGSALTISDWDFTVDTSNMTDNTNYTQFKLVRLNEDGSVGSTILDSDELATVAATSHSLTLSGDFSIPTDTTIRAGLVFDVENVPANAGDTVTCTLEPITTGDKVVDQNNDQLSESAITPNSAISGNIVDIVDSQLDVTRSTSVQATGYSKGTTNANLVALQFQAGSAQNQTIKEVKLGIYSVDDFNGNNDGILDSCATDVCVLPSDSILNVQLMDGATVLATKNVVNASAVTGLGEINFTNLTVNVPKDTTKVLTVRAFINNTATADLFGVFVNDIVAVDGQGRNTTGIDFTAIDTYAEAPAMAITTPTVTGSASTLDVFKRVVAAEETFQTLRFKLRSEDGNTTLQDFTVDLNSGEINGIKSASVHLLTGGVCGPSLKTGIVDTANTEVRFDNVGILLENNKDTTICISLTNNTVAGSTELTSGEWVEMYIDETLITDLRDSTNNNIAGTLNAFSVTSPVPTYIYRSVPVVTKNSISSVLSSGTLELASLSLAKSGENFDLTQLRFDLNATGITTIANCKLYNGNTLVANATSCSTTDAWFDGILFTVDSTKSLSLKADVTVDGTAQQKSLGVTLANDTDTIEWDDGDMSITGFGDAIIESAITWSLN